MQYWKNELTASRYGFSSSAVCVILTRTRILVSFLSERTQILHQQDLRGREIAATVQGVSPRLMNRIGNIYSLSFPICAQFPDKAVYLLDGPRVQFAFLGWLHTFLLI